MRYVVSVINANMQGRFFFISTWVEIDVFIAL